MSYPKYRATLEDGDTTRERPLTIYGEDLREIERWAEVVLKSALDCGAVYVFQSIEQQIKLIPKPKAAK